MEVVGGVIVGALLAIAAVLLVMPKMLDRRASRDREVFIERVRQGVTEAIDASPEPYIIQWGEAFGSYWASIEPAESANPPMWLEEARD